MADYEESQSSNIGLSSDSARETEVLREQQKSVGLTLITSRSCTYERILTTSVGLTSDVSREGAGWRELTSSIGLTGGEAKTAVVFTTAIGLSSTPARKTTTQREQSALQMGLTGGPAEDLHRFNVSVGLAVVFEYEGPAYELEFSASMGLTSDKSHQPHKEVLTASIGLRKRIAANLPKTFDPVLEYYTGGVWVTETDLISFSIDDTVGSRTRVLEAEVSNPDSSKESTYSSYMEMRIRDDISDEVLFYGKLEDTNPTEATLRLMIKDGLAELAERRVDSLTGCPYGRRSDLITALIQQNSYGTNFSLALETSAIAGSFTRDFSATDSGPSVISEIERLAMEDPWDATPTGYGYDYYTTYVSDWIKQQFEYFKRGSRPTAPVSTNGLTLTRGGTVGGDQERGILPGYKITKEGSNIVTCVRVFYEIPKDAANPDLGKYRTYAEEINSSLETAIGRRKMLIINRPEISNTTEAQALAQAALNRLALSDIYRASISFQGFPLIKVSGVYTLVRASHMVYVTGLSGNHASFNNTDMFLTKMRYSWPANTTSCELLVDKAQGSNFAGFDPLEYFSRQADRVADIPRETSSIPSGMPVPPYEAANIDKGVLPVASNLVFTSVNEYRISWTSGNVTWADGISQAIASGYYDIPDTKRYYFYAEYGTGTLNIVSEDNYDSSVGNGKGLIAIARRNTTSGEYAYLASIGTDTPIVCAGQIICASLSAIKADMGLLTAGEIRLGSGTVGSNFTGVRIYKSGSTYRIAGYNLDTIQALFDSDGKLKGGWNGSEYTVTISTTGIVLETPIGSATAALRFTKGGSTCGSIYASDTLGLVITALYGQNLKLYSTTGYIDVGTIPSSNPSVYGALYRDGSTVKMSLG